MNKIPTFKELLRQDVKSVFLNPAEFGEEHIVNGKPIYKKQTLVFVSALDFGPLPGVGKPVKIDGVTFIITDSLNEGGVYSLHLEANKS